MSQTIFKINISYLIIHPQTYTRTNQTVDDKATGQKRQVQVYKIRGVEGGGAIRTKGEERKKGGKCAIDF